MKSRKELHQELRQSILGLPSVTERQNAGIHEDTFFVGPMMFMHIHGYGHCDIRLPKDVQARVLAEGHARPHRWAPEAGYVTLVVNTPNDLEPAMELIRLSHDYFASAQKHPCRATEPKRQTTAITFVGPSINSEAGGRRGLQVISETLRKI